MTSVGSINSVDVRSVKESQKTMMLFNTCDKRDRELILSSKAFQSFPNEIKEVLTTISNMFQAGKSNITIPAMLIPGILHMQYESKDDKKNYVRNHLIPHGKEGVDWAYFSRSVVFSQGMKQVHTVNERFGLCEVREDEIVYKIPGSNGKTYVISKRDDLRTKYPFVTPEHFHLNLLCEHGINPVSKSLNKCYMALGEEVIKFTQGKSNAFDMIRDKRKMQQRQYVQYRKEDDDDDIHVDYDRLYEQKMKKLRMTSAKAMLKLDLFNIALDNLVKGQKQIYETCNRRQKEGKELEKQLFDVASTVFKSICKMDEDEPDHVQRVKKGNAINDVQVNVDETMGQEEEQQQNISNSDKENESKEKNDQVQEKAASAVVEKESVDNSDIYVQSKFMINFLCICIDGKVVNENKEKMKLKIKTIPADRKNLMNQNLSDEKFGELQMIVGKYNKWIEVSQSALDLVYQKHVIEKYNRIMGENTLRGFFVDRCQRATLIDDVKGLYGINLYEFFALMLSKNMVKYSDEENGTSLDIPEPIPLPPGPSKRKLPTPVPLQSLPGYTIEREFEDEYEVDVFKLCDQYGLTKELRSQHRVNIWDCIYNLWVKKNKGKFPEIRIINNKRNGVKE